ncbi:MAG: hypothetical protein ACRDIB_01750, partial [Ardenticatenaceae bacterium]
QMVRLLTKAVPGATSEWATLGLLTGLALITKTLAWVVLPLALLTAILIEQGLVGTKDTDGVDGSLDDQSEIECPGAHRTSHILHPASLLLISALFILPWFARNAAAYPGLDVMGLQQHDRIAVGQPRTADEVARRGLTGTILNGTESVFHSFWGQFGWMKAPLQPREYLVLALFSLAALAGLLLWLWRREWQTWGINSHVLLFFAVWILTNVAMLLYYNLEFVQYQGRYLFPALTPIAFFIVTGLGAWLPPGRRPLAVGPLLLFLLYLDYLAIVERLPGMLGY